MGYGGYDNYGPSQVAGAGYGPSPVAGYGPCSQVAGAGYAPTPGYSNTFTLIVVLFILLIIIGATYTHC